MVCDALIVYQGIIRVRDDCLRRLAYAFAITSYSRQDVRVGGSLLLRRAIGHVNAREACAGCYLRYIYSQARVYSNSWMFGAITFLLGQVVEYEVALCYGFYYLSLG